MSWRKGQWEAVEETVSAEVTYVANNAPTGFGKSAYGGGVMKLNGGRGLYLTATKSLQDDVSQKLGLFDMRGRQNYRCVAGNNINCTEGRILGCKDGSCPYKCDRDTFLGKDFTSTNYAYYLSTNIHSEGCGDIDTLVCDEAHLIDKELCSAIEISFEVQKFHFLFDALGRPPESSSLAEWRSWAQSQVSPAKAYLQTIKGSSAKHKWLTLTDSYVSLLSRMAEVTDDWIMDQSAPGKTVFSPLWPTAYTDKYLFRGIERVILMSATIVPKTLTLLNIPLEQSLLLSQPYTFDPNRCPVYLFGSVFVDNRTDAQGWQQVLGRMDTIIGHRLDRKGIIHTTSYPRQKFIRSNSEYGHLMIDPGSASELPAALEEFRKAKAPKILISPSVTTGYDFPGSDCEYQILIKVPFVPPSPIMDARAKADKEYKPYLTAQTLVQTCGRGMRSETDRCESFILDRHANRFLGKPERGGYPHLVPNWFHRQLRWPSTHPNPPPPLNTR